MKKAVLVGGYSSSCGDGKQHIPSIVVVAVNVEDLLPLDAQHAEAPPGG